MARNEIVKFEVLSYMSDAINKYYKENKELRGYDKMVDLYEEIAEYAGISPSTVSQMKNRGTNPSYIVAIKIAEFLKMSPTDIWKVSETKEHIEREKCVIDGCDRIAGTNGHCLKHVHLNYV